MSGSSSGNGVAGRMDSDGNATGIGVGGAGIDNNNVRPSGVVNDGRNNAGNEAEFAHIYKFSQNPPIGLKHYLVKKYKLSSLVLNKLLIDGKLQIIATAIFKNKSDYDDAEVINVKIDGKDHTFEALKKVSEDDKNTPKGIYVPRRVKRVNLRYVPKHMATPEILRKIYSDYFSFEDKYVTPISYKDGLYTGRIVILVSEFKKIPAKFKEIDYLDSDSKVFDIPIKVQIEVQCSWFLLGENGLGKDSAPPKKCHYCKRTGHFIGQCVRLRQKQQMKICKLCSSIDTCFNGNCINIENIRNGILNKKPNKFKERQTLSEKIQEKISTIKDFPKLSSQTKRSAKEAVQIKINQPSQMASAMKMSKLQIPGNDFTETSSFVSNANQSGNNLAAEKNMTGKSADIGKKQFGKNSSGMENQLINNLAGDEDQSQNNLAGIEKQTGKQCWNSIGTKLVERVSLCDYFVESKWCKAKGKYQEGTTISDNVKIGDSIHKLSNLYKMVTVYYDSNKIAKAPASVREHFLKLKELGKGINVQQFVNNSYVNEKYNDYVQELYTKYNMSKKDLNKIMSVNAEKRKVCFIYDHLPEVGLELALKQ